MTRGRFEIVPRRAMAAGLYRELVALCGEAYEEDFTELMEGYGPDAVHVVGLDGDTPVTHALWVPCRLRAGSGTLLAASVEALATRPSHLGRGLASAVMRLVVEETGRAGFDLCVLWAFDVAWYERLGQRPAYREHVMNPLV